MRHIKKNNRVSYVVRHLSPDDLWWSYEKRKWVKLQDVGNNSPRFKKFKEALAVMNSMPLNSRVEISLYHGDGSATVWSQLPSHVYRAIYNSRNYRKG